MPRSVVTDTPRVILQNPPWMDRPWRIRSFDSDLGVAYHDILLFTTAGKVKILKNGHTGTQTQTKAQIQAQTQTQGQDWGDWGKSCQLTPAGLSGLTTLGNKPFLIQYNSSTKHLTCHIPPLEVGTSAKMPGPGATWVAEEGGGSVPPPPKNTDISQG
jgi:hypothetical protein